MDTDTDHVQFKILTNTLSWIFALQFTFRKTLCIAPIIVLFTFKCKYIRLLYCYIYIPVFKIYSCSFLMEFAVPVSDVSPYIPVENILVSTWWYCNKTCLSLHYFWEELLRPRGKRPHFRSKYTMIMKNNDETAVFILCSIFHFKYCRYVWISSGYLVNWGSGLVFKWNEQCDVVTIAENLELNKRKKLVLSLDSSLVSCNIHVATAKF